MRLINYHFQLLLLYIRLLSLYNGIAIDLAQASGGSVARLFAVSCIVARERAAYGTEAGRVRLKGSEASASSGGLAGPAASGERMLSASCSHWLVRRRHDEQVSGKVLRDDRQ